MSGAFYMQNKSCQPQILLKNPVQSKIERLHIKTNYWFIIFV
jgi:hypothetical protein